MPRSFPHFNPQAGLSLLEMSVVLAIVALVTVGTFSMGSSIIESVRKVNTNNKLDAIETALMAFRLANNRLPCPSDATQTDTPANANTYGDEADNASGTCSGGSPSANFSYTLPSSTASAAVGTTVAEGAVPVRALSLPDEFQFDGWGRKFSYAVWTPLTATNAFITYGVTPNCGAITVQNAGHGYRTTNGAYALISYGPDGHGGYLKGGGTRFSSGSDNADELTNCHCNSRAANRSYTATYVEQDPTQSNPNDPLSVFGDLVRFKERWQMQNAYDTYHPSGLPCTPSFRADGVTGNGSGVQVAVGDVNGDGIPDLLITSPRGPAGWVSYTYVVFGTPAGFPDPLPLASLNGTNGFLLQGVYANGGYGAVATGDINGDGIADILIGSNAASPSGLNESGVTYVVFGRTNWSRAAYTLDNNATTGLIDGTQGVEFDGAAVNDASGSAVAAGNLTGHSDRTQDLVIGAYQGILWYNGGPGKVYVIVGQRRGWKAQYSLSDASLLDGTHGFEIDGGSSTGSADGIGDMGSVATGNVSGHRDGTIDLVLGAPGAGGSKENGATYIVFGGKGTWPAAFPVSGLNGSSGVNGTSGTRLDGSTVGGMASSTHDLFSGRSVAVGNINGDGYADLLIGAYGSSNGYAGAADVVFGHAPPWPAVMDLGTLNGGNGFHLSSVTGGDQTGFSVAVGDVNGDGFADMIIGSGCGWNNSNAGNTYVVFGGPGPETAPGLWQPRWPAFLSLGTLDGSNGTVLAGATPGDCVGFYVAAGDLMGDGYAAIVTGAPWANYNGEAQSGSTYVYFGKRSGWSASYDLGGL